MQPKVSIVILNWNNFSDSDECLRSLSEINYSDYNILLVDNGSTDDSAQELENKYPQITLIKNQKNAGFAEGNNIGIKQAIQTGAEIILLLNNDTVVRKDFLLKMIESMFENKADIVGPKILQYGSNNIWYCGGGINQLTGLMFHYGEGQNDSGQYNLPKSVDFVSGCALMAQKSVFSTLGMLDSDYYFGYEDADFCYKAKKKGIKLFYAPSAVIYHKLSQSLGGRASPAYLYFRTRNHLLLKRKNNIQALLFWPFFFFLIIKRIIGSLCLGRPKGALAVFWAVYDFYKGNWGVGSSGRFYQ